MKIKQEITRTVISRSLLEEYGYDSDKISDERLEEIADELLEHWGVSGNFGQALETVMME